MGFCWRKKPNKKCAHPCCDLKAGDRWRVNGKRFCCREHYEDYIRQDAKEAVREYRSGDDRSFGSSQ